MVTHVNIKLWTDLWFHSVGSAADAFSVNLSVLYVTMIGKNCIAYSCLILIFYCFYLKKKSSLSILCQM